MARLALTPVQQAQNTPTDLASLVTALSADTGVTFSNDGRVRLVVVLSGATTCSIKVGEQVDGESVADLAPTLTSGHTYVFPAFGPEITETGANAGQVWVDFGTPASVSAGLLAS